MQLDTLTHRIHHTALPPDARQFSIEANAKAFNMMLSSIYSDKPRAVLRELAQNAYDAHQEAGIDQPIEITLPTTLSPILRVNDSGAGMDRVFMLNGYCSLTHSTKDANSALVGGLGIGRLAPLSMSESYTVATTHAGVRTTYMVFLDEARIPSITVLTSHPSNDVAGTLIEVPLTQSQLGLFRQDTVARALEYFPAGSLRLNAYEGAAPTVEYSLRTKQFGLRAEGESYYSRGARLVMGPVAYPIDWSVLFADLDSADSLLELRGVSRLDIFAPIGTVNVAPSREALDYTPQGIRRILAVLRDAQTSIADEVQRDIEAQPYPALRVTRAYQLMRANLIKREQVNDEKTRLFDALGPQAQSPENVLSHFPELYASEKPPLIIRVDDVYRAHIRRRRKQVDAARQAFVTREDAGASSIFVDLDDAEVQHVQQLTGLERWHLFAAIWARHGPAQPTTQATNSAPTLPLPRAPRRPTQFTIINATGACWSSHAGYAWERKELPATDFAALVSRNDTCWFETVRGKPLLERMIQSNATDEQFAVAQRLLMEYMDVRTMLGVSMSDKKALRIVQKAGTPRFSTLLERALCRLTTDARLTQTLRLGMIPRTRDILRASALLGACESMLPALATRFSDSLFAKTLNMIRALNVANDHWLCAHIRVAEQLFDTFPAIKRPIWESANADKGVAELLAAFFVRYPLFDTNNPYNYRYAEYTLPAIEHYLNLIEQ